MKLPSTRWVRRAVAVAFIVWAVFALALSASIFFASGDRLHHPFTDTRIATTAILQSLAPSARDSEAQPGDLLLEVNGEPYGEVLRRGSDWLEPGVRNAYLLEKRDGSRVLVDLAPAPV